MSKIVIYENIKTLRRGYRDVPHRYEDDWVPGFILLCENGEDKLKIVEVVDENEFDAKVVSNYNKHNFPDIYIDDRQSLSNLVKVYKALFKIPQNKAFFDALNITENQLNFKNLRRSITILKVNERVIPVKIVKRNSRNNLTLNYLSRYIGEEIEDVELEFSVLDEDFIDMPNDENIIIYNMDPDNYEFDTEYTLKIYHDFRQGRQYEDILNRLSEYLKLEEHK